MRKNYSWISELALVTVVSSLVLLMSPLGSVASPGDWSIKHNWEWVPNGQMCHVLASDGVNYVNGTFEWNTSGLGFNHTYDESSGVWFDAQPAYQSGYYYFDFWTAWDDPYGEKFIIRSPTLGAQHEYWCYLPL